MMETKDYFTLALSSSAFILSLITTIITLKQKKYEIERGLRQQITDVISKLNTVFEQENRLENEAQSSNPRYAANMRSFFNGQKQFFARQAVYLINQLPALVSEAEYNAVARAFEAVADYEQADYYYRKALEASPSTLYEAINLRGHGRVLFKQGRIAEGRTAFQESLNLIPSDTDRHHMFRGDTYERWVRAEADALFFDEADKHFHSAEVEYQAIKLQRLRNERIAILNALRMPGSSHKEEKEGNSPTE
jgi:tetratricopeptide (TPR) repeat protein